MARMTASSLVRENERLTQQLADRETVCLQLIREREQAYAERDRAVAELESLRQARLFQEETA